MNFITKAKKFFTDPPCEGCKRRKKKLKKAIKAGRDALRQHPKDRKQ